MLFSELPTELWLVILEQLGLDFFRQDVRRLTISKQWYSIVWPLFVRDLDLTAKSLVELERTGLLTRMSSHTTTVKIFLNGYEDPVPSAYESDSASSDSDALRVADAREWAFHLNNSLQSLARHWQMSPNLRSLQLKAWPEVPLERPRDGYLMYKSIAALLKAPHLTFLEVDIVRSYPMRRKGEASSHFCSAINSLLPLLRRLRCRMETICPCLLQTPQCDRPYANLEELIINLSLSSVSDAMDRYRLSNWCGRDRAAPRDSNSGLVEAIELQAATIATRMEKPRMVRVISHEINSLPFIRALDAITGDRFILRNNAQWDATGERIGGIHATISSQ